MGLKKLFTVLKTNKGYRKDWYIKWKFECVVNTNDYMFFILPTIVWTPWPYRRHGEHILEIAWLNCAIGTGEWRRRGNA